MTRLNLSFLAAFLVLAVCAMSLPTKRDEGHGFGLEKALSGLEKIPKIMEALDPKDTKDNQNQDDKHAPADDTKKTEEKADEKADEKTEKPVANKEEKEVDTKTPTATEKKPYTGKFATPTATHTDKPSSKPNALGAIPIVGGILGGTGTSL
ncbi:hypothetical protein N7532_007521 [Penicillium argentinense]|uniref:Cell wall protein n=1 Tax=Penicillium argentinense TaxID=1131581 RepID=A0A9W9F823_9EURO|nr:uncharacterized protein N7532_007521 [Penicillium argentinense]KAJ5095230.1 hypothetical protein N7532_007521 [Penicillium argentinense]